MGEDGRSKHQTLFGARDRKADFEQLLRQWGLPLDFDGLSLDDLLQVGYRAMQLSHSLKDLEAHEDMTLARRENLLHELRIYRIGVSKRRYDLQQEHQMAEINDVVAEKVEDPQVRQQLSELVAEFSRQQQEFAVKLHEQEDIAAQELRRIELQERRWRMRKSLLDREPAAVLIGGLLLLLITVTLIIGMFAHTQTPDILANGFLLILGFFFGQTSHRARPTDMPT